MTTAAFLKNRFRLLLFLAQGGCCAICGQPMSFNRKKNGAPAHDFATFEHVDRREDGGHLTTSNTCLTHYKCNIRRNAEHQKKSPAVAGPASGEVLSGDRKREPLTTGNLSACVEKHKTDPSIRETLP